MTHSVFTDEYNRFKRKLIEMRKGVGMTQSDLADALGKPQSYVSKYESGERRLDVVEFISIARALDRDPAVLIADLVQEINCE